MDAPPLSQFIVHARSKGMDFGTIRALLLAAGWKEKDVLNAMSSEQLDLAVPLPPDAGGARDASLHLLAFGGFHTAIISLVLLFFALIDRRLPDVATDDLFATTDRWNSTLRWLVAQIVISFPLFLIPWRYLLGEIRQRPEKAVSPIRRWLTFLTLLLAIATLTVTAMTLLYYFLDGELTLRFVLKVLLLSLLAALSLVYFVGALSPNRGQAVDARWHRTFGWLAGILVAAGLVWGMSAVGSPFQQRYRKLDQRRLADLRVIVDEIERIVVQQRRTADAELKRPLPANLDELVAAAEFQRPSIRDPETGVPYRYEVLDERRFRLCADFRFPRDESLRVIWNHPAGEACFEFDVLEISR